MTILFIVLACLFGLMMTWSVGANDLANIMSTTLGSRSVTIRNAIIIAIIFEFAGAFLGGSGVSHTLRDGIINTQLLIDTPNILLYGMLAVLLSATTWMLIASYFGLPVSVTNATVGAIVGFGSIVLGVHAMHWKQVIYIAISWVSSPLIAGILAYLLFINIQRLILIQSEPFVHAKRYAPIYLFVVGIILSLMVLVKGLKHFHIVVTPLTNFVMTLGTAFVVTLIGSWVIQSVKLPSGTRRLHAQFIATEKVFAILMALTACAMVFAHGSNDVAIAVGPMAEVITIATSGEKAVLTSALPAWIVFLGASGVIVGLLMYGRKVIETVGHGITTLTPSRAFSATIAAASTVVVSTSFGIPVSATQTLIGAIFGVGLARGIDSLNLRVVRNIFTSWIITLPIGAGLAIMLYYLFHIIFGA
ncbi:MAG: inorganic phosphate transporter [Gammaproteobacteria bacterium]